MNFDTNANFDISDTAPERKAGISPAPLGENDDFRHNFEEFRASNDQRLDAAGAQPRRRSARGKGRPHQLRDRRAKPAHRRSGAEAGAPGDGGPRPGTDTGGASTRARSTATSAAASRRLRALETKALSAGSNADGGYLVPVELEHDIGAAPCGDLADPRHPSVREISSSIYKKPFMTAGPATGWVGETDARPQTTSPTLDALSFPAMELYAMPAATATLLDDSAVNIDEWIASEVEHGSPRRKAPPSSTATAPTSRRASCRTRRSPTPRGAWGNLGYVASGAAGAFASSNPSDVLVDLIYALKAGYRQNGAFVMNRKTQAQIRKFKDSGGAYLWQPPAQAGGRASLMTFPLVEAEDMPDIAANSLSIAFGDFRRGYLIVDRTGVRVLRDPYSAKPYVLFYTTKRVGGGVQDFDAIKLMKFAVAEAIPPSAKRWGGSAERSGGRGGGHRRKGAEKLPPTRHTVRFALNVPPSPPQAGEG